MSDLTNTQEKVLSVESQKTVLPTKIGTEEFATALLEEFTGKHAWRSSASLATKLGVDAKELETFLNKNPKFIRKCSDDSVFYALLKRVSEDKPNNNEKKTKVKNKPLHPKDRYALSAINLLSEALEKVVDQYAARIHDQSEESLSHLTKSLKHLKSATVLLAQATSANQNHLISLD